ncbi:MAG: HAD-IIIA family hydrolase [Nanoarchaeota archaeon]|nr:HAD-IIIA family hydrolase [Nanoarchaeota archaeon]
MNPAIFLDRDGTLVVDHGYVYKVDDFRLHEEVIEGLKLLKDFRLFVITNQSGIGRGYYKEEDMHNFNNRMLKEISKHGIKIEKIYFCPHTPEEKCECRKPKTKFIKQAKEEFNIGTKNSWVIGDHDSDVLLAKNTGCNAVYLLTGHGKKHLKEARNAKPEYIAATLKQAAEYILFNKEKKIIKRESLKDLINELRKQNKKIVTINGAFDVLHKGHEKILSEAKKQGNILITAINSDSSVKENKGLERPLNNENARAKMLANFNYVDYVTVFPEKTPIDVLNVIRPDIHVNGSEYGENCIEAETVKKNGGKIYIVNLLPDYSTTSLITGK